MKSILDEIARQKTAEFKHRAYDWADEVQRATQGSLKPVPWKKIAISIGIVGAILTALKLFASFRDREAIQHSSEPVDPILPKEEQPPKSVTEDILPKAA